MLQHTLATFVEASERAHAASVLRKLARACTAHEQEEAFCKAKGGRLPTRLELCPSYSANAATSPALGCENSHSWMPYAGDRDQWMYVGCAGTGHHECKDHMTHHSYPRWGSGDQYGDKIDCMVP